MSIFKRAKQILQSKLNDVLSEDYKYGEKEKFEDDFMRQAAEEMERELGHEEEKFDTDEFAHKTSKWYKRPFRDEHIAKCYARLEIPYGSDLETTKKAWRTLMKKYHPDRYARNPEQVKWANDMAHKINQAYRDIEEFLKKEKN